MERDCKRKKTKKRQSFKERSPLQHLNGLPIDKRNIKKSSHFSSSSSAPAASRPLLSHNNNISSSSSLSSSSRTHTYKKPTFSSIRAKNEPNQSRVRTSYETPRKPFLQPSRKEKPRLIKQRKNSQSDAKPTCKIWQRSKLSSAQGKSEKGSDEFQKKMKKNSDDSNSGNCTLGLRLITVSNDSNSNCAENSTPVCRMVASGFGSHSLNFCDHESAIDDLVYEGGNADVKTPPVEASLSPEIQCQSQSRMLLLNSVGTPVCYGAGQLVSGVSDKRNSKRRGSLKGGPGKGILFPDARRDENVSVDLHESSIPLLAEASVRWHSSPCGVGREDHEVGFGNRLDQDRMVYDDALDFLCGESSFSGSDRVRNVAIDRRNSDAIFSPGKATLSPRILEALRCNMDESLASLNSGNIIQTPDSETSSDTRFRTSRLEVHLSNSFWLGFDSINEMLDRVKLSPRSEVSMWDVPGLGSRSVDIGLPPVSEDVDSVSSWVSDATNDNPTLSQMRISSWCEGLDSEIVETDEFDCCCCLSDEEVDGDETDRGNNNMVVASVENKDNGFRIGDELSPVLLDYETCLHDEGKGKSFSLGVNECAESICTDGGGLLASDDSDWTCFQEISSIHVT